MLYILLAIGCSVLVSVLLKHSEAKVFLVESQFHAVARDALRLLADAKDRLPLVITVSDPSSSSTGGGCGSNDGSVAVAGGSADLQLKRSGRHVMVDVIDRRGPVQVVTTS